MARNFQKQPKRPSSYILLGSLVTKKLSILIAPHGQNSDKHLIGTVQNHVERTLESRNCI